ncbi:MAG: glutamine-hydrolyzing GMP synthase [Christensenellaceae bacterium]|jgi:GMP synthase (glutamine-hydrolysing)|nr:glutamine-hydrolyzing GMP synthase [Christensenellaceae bacterium]
MDNNEIILVLDFGGQYNQLIVRRIRDLGVYSELRPYSTTIEDIKKINPIGIIFTGGPNSVFESDSLSVSRDILNLGIPILGICYGAQLIAHLENGKVATSSTREYGGSKIVYSNAPLFDGIPSESTCWMSHTDFVAEIPKNYTVLASTKTCRIAAFGDIDKKIYGLQFHPEVIHTENGDKILENFIYKVANAHGDWAMKNFVESSVAKIKSIVGMGTVLCAMSGGIDSAVAATLVHKAVGDRLTCVLVDHGLMRKNECAEIMSVFRDGLDMNLKLIDARDRFLSKLTGVSDPDAKRKIIGAEFIRVFEDFGKTLGNVDFLVQGTIYPDVVESGFGKSAAIKLHHNVGGLPAVINFKEIIEPLRDLFKDEVRKVGFELGLPKSVVMRQPFPGPGLAIRIIGDITEDKLEILREADAIFRSEISDADLDSKIWQYFAVLTGVRSIGVMGDMRTYDYMLALRAVVSLDAMSADWAKIPWPVLEKISNRIVNECRNINRVVYDITTKPPATIEWE